jgi:predicted DNA-binding protein with PD1-like motif
MIAIESRRVRHLVLRFDRGEELPSALQRALDEAQVRAGWLTGIGTLEAAEITQFDPRERRWASARRIDVPMTLASLTGNIASLEGAGSTRLVASLSKEGDVGVVTAGGELVWARVAAVEVHVTAFEDAPLTRIADDRTGLPVLARGTGSILADSPPPAAASVAIAHVAPEPVRAAIITPPPAAPPPEASKPRVPPSSPGLSGPPPGSIMTESGVAMPARPATKHRTDVDVYPEDGDIVNHFHFGDCIVVGSDGDRIRLRQDRDSRIREVALAMLKIELVSQDAETNQRTFRLHRKN